MVEVFTSRSGVPSLRVGGVAIHSPYDPVREACRFIETSLADERPSLVVILGEGLGYLGSCVESGYPTARVLRVCYSPEIFRHLVFAPSAGRAAGASDTWHPGLDMSIEVFLRKRIGELDLEGLKVLEWPPSARLFPEQSRQANEALQGLLRELNGSLVTTTAMGRLWLRNIVSNFLFLDGALTGAPCSRERAVVITASGPSLEEAAPLLREARSSFDIWALPSSALFLREAGLRPDLFVMTDPGFYAIHHLHHAPPACPVAMPLSAARGLWGFAHGPPGPGTVFPFLIEQPGLLESDLLRTLELPAPVIAPHGTVAASALDLARASTSGPIILAGLDLSTNDVASHARPNELETLHHLQASRISPSDGLWYRRSADMQAARVPGSARARAPLSLRTYAGWKGWRQAGTAKVYRLLPSVIDLPGLIPLNAASFRELARGFPSGARGSQLARSLPFPSRRQRASRVVGLLSGWQRELEAGIREAQGQTGHRALVSPSLLALVGQVSTANLLDTKRRARLGDEKGARESAIAALEECGRFVDELTARAQNAG